VRGGLNHWNQAFWSGPPALTREDDGAVLRFTDTRRCALEESCEISGLAREVYLACDDAPVEERLKPALAGRLGREEAEVGAAVEELRRRHLLLRIDGRLVSLALQGPLPALTDSREFPGGMVEDGNQGWA
jgi:hypothetical protein